MGGVLGARGDDDGGSGGGGSSASSGSSAEVQQQIDELKETMARLEATVAITTPPIRVYATDISPVSQSFDLSHLETGIYSVGGVCTVPSMAALTLASTVQVIGERAFEGCTGMSRSTLKKSDGRRLSRKEAARIGLPVACECCILW